MYPRQHTLLCIGDITICKRQVFFAVHIIFENIGPEFPIVRINHRIGNLPEENFMVNPVFDHIFHSADFQSVLIRKFI